MLAMIALLLLLSGTATVLYAARLRQQALSKRVAIVLPETPEATGGARATANDEQTRLFRASRFADIETREVARSLAKWRWSPDWAPKVLTILRAISGSAVSLLTMLIGLRVQVLASSPLLVAALTFAMGVVGWFAVSWLLRRRASTRKTVIGSGLADALELLVVCVEAGLSLEDGLERVIAELEHSRPELAEELALTSADLKILPNRDDALNRFAQRVDLPSVRSLVTTLAQTMRYGTPLAQALRVVALDLRNDSLLRLEERASELPVMLTIPMMLFIMPTIFLIVGGPAALRVADIFLH